MKKNIYLLLAVLAVAILGVMTIDVRLASAVSGTSHAFLSNRWRGDGYDTITYGFTRQVRYTTQLDASVNMDVSLQTPEAVDPSIKIGASGYNCSSGGTFNMPISATGEVTGHMTKWYSSPPVEYLNDIVTGGKKWLGHTEGLCGDNFNSVCTYFPLKGVWSDAWTTNTAGVSCETVDANMGKCVIPAKDSGPINITLTRDVKNISWTNIDDIYHYPATMQSTVTVNCVAPVAALEVTSATNAAVSPTQGDLVNFDGTIKNSGNKTSTAFTPVLYIDEGSTGVWNKTISATSPSAALTAGAETNIIWTNAWTAIEGTHRYKICPDSSGNGCAIRNMVALPISLSCTTSPSSLAVGSSTPATLSAIGGTPAKKYRWFSDNLSDTFSSAVGATTTLLPKRQPGTTKVTVMNDYFLDVDGNGSITDNDRLLIVNKLNGDTTPVPLRGVIGQNQANPLNVDDNTSVNSSDVLAVVTAINNGKTTVDRTFCAPDITVQPTPIVSLSCAASPASVSLGNTASLSATGGVAANGYRWFSNNTADVFGSKVGATTSITPAQAGTTTAKVMNGSFLDVDGSGTVTTSDYNKVVACTNGACPTIAKKDVLGQNQINPYDVDGSGYVSAGDAGQYNATNTDNYTIPVVACSLSVNNAPVVTAPTASLEITKIGGQTNNGNRSIVSIAKGSTVELTWSASADATSCVNTFSATGTSGAVTRTPAPTSPATSITYSVTCKKTGAPDSSPATATVNVIDSVSGTNIRDF